MANSSPIHVHVFIEDINTHTHTHTPMGRKLFLLKSQEDRATIVQLGPAASEVRL